MTEQTNFDPSAVRRRFIERAWTILMRYLDRLDDRALIDAVDPRAGAGVVKTLFDAVDKAETGFEGEEEDIELPEIPQEIIDEFVARVLEGQPVPKKVRKTGRAAKSAVPHTASA